MRSAMKNTPTICYRSNDEFGDEQLQYGTAGSVGADLRFDSDTSLYIPTEAVATLTTGVRLELPPGYCAEVRGRSSMAMNGIFCHVGTIDSDYRGEIKVVLYNSSSKGTTIVPGQKIAQVVVQEVVRPAWIRRDSLIDPGTRVGGFGSTGDF